MKKYLTLLALLSLLFVNESDAQKLTFLDSFEIYHSSNMYSIDTIPNIFEDSSGTLRGYGVDKSKGLFYEFTYSNGKFGKSDSAEFKADNDMRIIVGETYNGERSITHYPAWTKPSISNATMALNTSKKQYKNLGSWKKGNGFSNYTGDKSDSNLIVNQSGKGFNYKGLYHFEGMVVGQGHNGEYGLYTFNGNSILRIKLDVGNDITNQHKYQVVNDTIYFRGKKSGLQFNVYKCDYKTGKILNVKPMFKDLMKPGGGFDNYYVRSTEGGGYFRTASLSNPYRIKIQEIHLGTIDQPQDLELIIDAAWFNNTFYLAHLNDDGQGKLHGYVSKYANGNWTSTKLNSEHENKSIRFIKSIKNLYVTYHPKRAIGKPLVHHVYSVDAMTSSIENLKNSTFSLYPNPSTGIYNIQSASDESINKVDVFNLLGTKLKEYEVNNQQHQLDISDLPTGMYVVRINEERTLRIVKSND